MIKTKFFIGLNDKDSHIQEIDTISAYKIIGRVAVEQLGFGTITEARGIYTHDDGTIVTEVTLVLEYNGDKLNKDKVKYLVNELKTILNQESIMIEETEITSRFM